MSQDGVLIVGSGAIARQHGKSIRKLRGSDYPLVVCSRSQASLEDFQKCVGGRVELLLEKDFESRRDLPTSALIASPPRTHIDWIEKLASRVSLLMVEKPAIVSLQELDRLRQLAERLPKLRLMVAENYDFKPSLDALRLEIGSGKYGRLRSVFLQKESFQKTNEWKSVCGTLFEGGIHFVALGNSLAGARPVLSSPEILDWRVNAAGVERGAHVSWKSESGVDITLRYAWDRPTFLKGLGQFSFLDFENARLYFESNGLWIQGLGIQLKDVTGTAKMMKEFLRLADDESLPVRRSGLEKMSDDLMLVFEIYSRAGSRVLSLD
jgi:predicted dehydrogenase